VTANIRRIAQLVRPSMDPSARLGHMGSEAHNPGIAWHRRYELVEVMPPPLRRRRWRPLLVAVFVILTLLGALLPLVVSAIAHLSD
jgi:hypothetical protein